ncbi:hypothetical protein KLM86_19215, partial [Clostridioides difficile]|nr:hypothetical protein [Clostridioides difficile]
HKIGEVVDLDGAKVSVKNVRKLESDSNVYAVEIEITNTGDTLKGEIAFELTKDTKPKTIEIAYENVGKYTVFDL